MNDKALLVMDMPEKGCISCVIGKNHSIPLETCIYCPICRKNAIGEETEKIPDWCPLKTVPRKKNYKSLSDANPVRAWGNGWNECIDEILEGCKDETN